MQLVEIKKFDLVTTSCAVAQGIKKDHKPVIQLVRKYKSDLEEFGRVEFEMRPFETNAPRHRPGLFFACAPKAHPKTPNLNLWNEPLRASVCAGEPSVG